MKRKRDRKSSYTFCFFDLFLLFFPQGAAIAAGKAVNKWDVSKHISNEATVIKPIISEEQRDHRYKQWKKAIERSLGWDI